jgi:D-alanyl-lipoteichoic acid acyltransferase DltB (MBOAT superfamily)
MLFNSFAFILGFLPLALGGYWLLANTGTARLWFLLAASLAFYSYWDWRFTPLLVGSIVVNWLAAGLYFAWRRRGVLVAAIVVDLLCLGVFKYLGFFDAIVADAAGWQMRLPLLALPLGISFFTFHHIIYLADLLRGTAPRYRFRDYALYIALFPQILAGPLVRHREIVPQFAPAPGRSGWDVRLAQGIGFFVIGLAKKLLFADPLAGHADPVFASAASGAISIGEAWTAALAFPLQIYFDFSGYSDMAIGLALLFGFVLPYNFEAPYGATSLRDFWRRWHMTLSRFLRDYLYIPMGGNRHGLPRQVWALMATFLLGGLWHGAGWTFVVWGGLHGAGLAAGVAWRRWLPPLPQPVGWLALMLFLIVTWVFFRAPSLHAAGNVLAAMAGWGTSAPVAGLRTIALAAAVALIGPNSQEFVARLEARRWVALAGAAVTALLLLKLGDAPSYEFIYFRF